MRPRPLSLIVVLTTACALSHARTEVIPAPALDAPRSATSVTRTAVVAGGCFWGIEAVYEHVSGVTKSVSGYAGGNAASARYELVSTGTTGHAEAVQITYDASRLTYGQILHVFFSVAHDPTQLNRQGPDHGPQYRSAIFAGNAEQEQIARAYIDQLRAARVFPQPIVTDVSMLRAFYPAEPEHQDYAARNPGDPYIRINDAPKVTALQKHFPDLFVSRK
jgi:peptide-methionine (S)-S-oxide reductase